MDDINYKINIYEATGIIKQVKKLNTNNTTIIHVVHGKLQK